MNNRAYGTIGEKEAMRHLASRGYNILCSNFRVGRIGEIDLIGKDRDTYCFIEVKTRSNTQYGTPAQAVSLTKQTTITRLAQIYMQRFHLTDVPVRFDIVEVMMGRDGQVQGIELIQNAF